MNILATPPEDLLRECDDLIERLDELLGTIEPMTPDEIRLRARIGKPREVVVAQLAELCEDIGVDHVAGTTVEAMLGSYHEVSATRIVIEKLDRVRARLDAKRLRAEANVAEHVFLFYDLARRVARGSDSLMERLEPVVAAFRTKRTRPSV